MLILPAVLWKMLTVVNGRSCCHWSYWCLWNMCTGCAAVVLWSHFESSSLCRWRQLHWFYSHWHVACSVSLWQFVWVPVRSSSRLIKTNLRIARYCRLPVVWTSRPLSRIFLAIAAGWCTFQRIFSWPNFFLADFRRLQIFRRWRPNSAAEESNVIVD